MYATAASTCMSGTSTCLFCARFGRTPLEQSRRRNKRTGCRYCVGARADHERNKGAQSGRSAACSRHALRSINWSWSAQQPTSNKPCYANAVSVQGIPRISLHCGASRPHFSALASSRRKARRDGMMRTCATDWPAKEVAACRCIGQRLSLLVLSWSVCPQETIAGVSISHRISPVSPPLHYLLHHHARSISRGRRKIRPGGR